MNRNTAKIGWIISMTACACLALIIMCSNAVPPASYGWALFGFLFGTVVQWGLVFVISVYDE